MREQHLGDSEDEPEDRRKTSENRRDPVLPATVSAKKSTAAAHKDSEGTRSLDQGRDSQRRMIVCSRLGPTAIMDTGTSASSSM